MTMNKLTAGTLNGLDQFLTLGRSLLSEKTSLHMSNTLVEVNVCLTYISNKEKNLIYQSGFRQICAF